MATNVADEAKLSKYQPATEEMAFLPEKGRAALRT
jgi:hypothetical protein